MFESGIKPYRPDDWTWFVVERGQFYASRTRSWLSESVDLSTRIETVAELIAVLEAAGFPDHAPLNANHVRRECQRRMMALTGARTAEDLSVKISNALREQARLNDLKLQGVAWTEQQTIRAAVLRAADAAIEHLRARSNEMEADPPEDYRDDARWA